MADLVDPVVLVGMSVREVGRRDELLEAARPRGATVAFLQVGDPSLHQELSRLADAGHRRIVLVGVSLGMLAPAHSWLRRIAAHWWRDRQDPPVVDIALELAKDLAPATLEEVSRALKPIRGYEPGIRSAAWEDVPSHRHQVLVCRGPRCTADGGEDALRGLILAMMEEGLGDDDVTLVHTGCQFPCNQAPVMSVQPDDVWYGSLDQASAGEMVRQHLVAGTPYAARRLPRERRA